MDLPDFLIDHADGEIRLAGHRLGLYDVISLYQQGYSAEKIGDEYPTLPVAVIHKLIAFYRKNQGEVDAYVAAYREELQRQEQAYAANPGALHHHCARRGRRGMADSFSKVFSARGPVYLQLPANQTVSRTVPNF